MTKYEPQEKYDKANCIRLSVKLNKNTDKDIIEFLNGKNKNGIIKEGIRKIMKELR